MTTDTTHAPVEAGPLAMMYHQNSKLVPASSAYLAESIAEFNADPEELLRLASAHKSYATSNRIELGALRGCPKPRAALERVLSHRRSCRSFGSKPLELPVLASLLQHALGVTGRLVQPDRPEITQPVRAAPSGGALYPVEAYIVTRNVTDLPPGEYHYQPVDHVLENISEDALKASWNAIVWPDASIQTASALIVLTGFWQRTLAKYGERGYRLLLLEAGHQAQNLLLVAEALGLGACPVAGFHDNRLAESLRLDPREEPPLYAVVIGTR